MRQFILQVYINVDEDQPNAEEIARNIADVVTEKVGDLDCNLPGYATISTSGSVTDNGTCEEEE